ncbi:MAG: DNA polymerase IV [Lachnospiraceae bacterium]|nr:DNA polymerase IV [Lachnospiraceae bacterium]
MKESVYLMDTVIYHVDVNSAFLSWESCYRLCQDPQALDLRTIPAIVGGNQETRHGIVLAKSTPAKKFGIQTGEPIVDAKRKCPNLTVVLPSYSCYVDYSRQLIDLLKTYAPSVEQYSIDEAFCDMTGTRKLYGDPVIFAETLKNMIRDRLGFTVNIGISSNKLLAKMASDFRKPDLVHTLFPEEVPTKMWPLFIDELFFVGQSTAKKLHELGISTIGDLAHMDLDVLTHLFKKHGEMIWNYANGKDMEIVTDHHHTANKSYGNSLTLHADVTDAETARLFLLSLSETVGARIRADKSYVGVVGVSIVDQNFVRQSKQQTLFSDTNVTEEIYQTACTLFSEIWTGVPIRQLGVFTGKASRDASYQFNLFDQDKYEKLSKLNTAVDSIRSKFGEDAIKRASFVNNDTADHMTGGLNRSRRNHKSDI